MTAQPALPLHMCPMAYILSADCVSPVADAWPKCAYQQWPGELASSSSRARVGAVSQSRRMLYCSCTRCARLRLARRRCRAHACLPARLASLRHVHMWTLPRILAERYHDTVRVQTCSHACDLSSTCAHVPAGDAGLLHLHALCLRFHTSARVHTHATCARWLENSPLTIACRASPVPGRCVHACLARLLMSSLSCIPAFSPNVVCVQDSIFCAILHVINLYKWCKN